MLPLSFKFRMVENKINVRGVCSGNKSTMPLYKYLTRPTQIIDPHVLDSINYCWIYGKYILVATKQMDGESPKYISSSYNSTTSRGTTKAKSNTP